jgi:putative ATP-dependent endonuclease of OLD family
MHRLAQISISNFRSCQHVTLLLDDFTPIVGYNNAGKSNILSAIEWLIDAAALSSTDFNSAKEPVSVEGKITGITEILIGHMPANQQKQIKPYVDKETLRFRRTMLLPGAGSTAKLEVRDPAVEDDKGEKAWAPNPTGIQQALKALFPESIRIHAMQDASDDVGKQAKGNTIGKLIADIIEPVRKDHEGELHASLAKLATKLSADGEERTAKLKEFDTGATTCLKDLFPGLQLKLDVPLPEIPDLFKNGTVRVFEVQGATTSSRTFEAVGHGAQRCIQMALIRYLAEKRSEATDTRRTLLLIDEPELYLHPQGIEQVRQALKQLAGGRYQVLFSTHSPLMLHRDHAGNTVMVRKPDPATGTTVRKPLATAVSEAITDGGHQARLLFELGNAAEVYFSDRVLLNEGKTEQRFLPLLYERHFGRAAGADRTGIVPLHGSNNFAAAFRILQSMEIDAKIVADLDYAFRRAKDLTEYKDHPDLAPVKTVIARLQQVHRFSVDGGLPKNDKKNGWTAAAAWALFAKDPDGAKIAAAEHAKLRAYGIWVWKEGTIEDAFGISDKGEEAIQTVEQGLAALTKTDVKANYPSVVEFFDWLTA